MPDSNRRIQRETKTIRHMIAIYCHGQRHEGGKICGDCDRLLDYALTCIDHCPHPGKEKPACGICPTHCFTPAMHREFNGIMRYAGPRMLLRHPLLTALHFLDALRNSRRMKRKYPPP